MNKKPAESPERILFLKKLPVFTGLKSDALAELAGLMQEKQAKAQETIFKKGDKGDHMYIILDGEVRVHDGNHVIARLQKGEVFGEFAIFDEETRSASVTTETSSMLLQLDRAKLAPLISQNPEILMGLLHTQFKRMRDMNELKEKLAKSYLKISRQKEEIEKQNTAIKEKSKLVEKQNEDLKQLNEEKRQLMSVLIHGLKNPMTSAMMMADLITQQTAGNEQLTEYLHVLKQSMQRMDKVFNEIIRDNQRDEPETETPST